MEDSIVSTVSIVGSVGSQRLGARNVCSSLLADDNRHGPVILTVAEDHRIGRLPGDRQAAVDAAEAAFGLQERARRPR